MCKNSCNMSHRVHLTINFMNRADLPFEVPSYQPFESLWGTYRLISQMKLLETDYIPTTNTMRHNALISKKKCFLLGYPENVFMYGICKYWISEIMIYEAWYSGIIFNTSLYGMVYMLKEIIGVDFLAVSLRNKPAGFTWSGLTI